MDNVDFGEFIEAVGKGADLLGVAVIVVGVLFALVTLFRRRARRSEDPILLLRHRIGRAILLGLEILVAADIIRTVAVAPSFKGVGVLAAIVAIRTFLSMSLELEITGRWPWQPRPQPADA